MVVVGAVLGVAGYALEQARADWHPHVQRTSRGWRVNQPYLGINEPSLGGDHLAWQAGPYTIVMDLRSGRIRPVGAARDAQSLTPPVVSPDATMWLEYAGASPQRTLVYAFDFASGRRRLLLQTSAYFDVPALAGTTAYWLRSRGGATAVVACDLRSGRRDVLATGNGIGPFLLAGGTLVAWSQQTQPAAPFTLSVRDLTDGSTRVFTLPGQSSGAVFDTPILASDTLAWLRVDKQSGLATISTYDLTTLAARQIVSGRGLVGPGFDGSTVVWAQPAASGSGKVLMGLRLSGGAPFLIADAPAGVESVMVSGDTVAWWVGTGPRSFVETTRIPQ